MPNELRCLWTCTIESLPYFLSYSLYRSLFLKSMYYRQGQLFLHVLLHSNAFEFNKVVEYIYYAASEKDKIVSLNKRSQSTMFKVHTY